MYHNSRNSIPARLLLKLICPQLIDPPKCNIGLGKETTLQLSKHKPAHIYLSARTPPKGLAAIEDIKASFATPADCPPITFIKCDLASLPSVVEAAREFTSKEKRLDKLYLNAGVMALPPGVTEQGYEIQFGTNHLGHQLLTKLLLPTLLKTAEEGADVRVVTLSSAGHIGAWGISFDKLKSSMDSLFTSTGVRYAQSKLANILFAKELARRYPSITSVVIHPGVVKTELWVSMINWKGVGKIIPMIRDKFYTSVEDGAKNQLWAGTAEGVNTGTYYAPVGVTGQETRTGCNMELAKKLWDWTDKELEPYTL
ncbi:hypothetical protein BJ878DRAFT_483524 [Calycina marina]|uniref:Protochlorophyllide reductase n=1 Tax=Calycina marina TaxID=1763456 RepID=A0A9P7YVX3_9HELO|nr:hypothetical protein BJ878DRAFT_483524 [Calycina marina]